MAIMKRLTKASRLLLVACIAMPVVTNAGTGIPAQDLGTLGGPGSVAVALNNVGQVVGWSHTADGTYHAFLWTKAGGMIDLGAPAGCASSASAINDAGQVVGEYSCDPNSPASVFLWTQAEGMVDLGIINCGTWLGVNSTGQVSGTAYSVDGCQAFLWTRASGVVGLGVHSEARAMNDLGQVAGTSQGLAFFWRPEIGTVDWGTFGGWYAGANSVNISGQVVGEAVDAYGSNGHPFLWDALAGLMVQLEPNNGGTANGVNESGQVVGELLLPDYSPHAFSWTKAGGMVDLGSFDSSNSRALAVNESGQVIGLSSYWGFVWMPATGMVKLGPSELDGSLDESFPKAINDGGQIVGYVAVNQYVRAALWDVGPPTQFGGFLQPITSTEVNPAKAGANVSVKWQLLDQQGGVTCDVSLIRSVQYQRVNCEGLPVGDDLIPAATSGQSGLRCENGLYTYNWKTTKAMAGNCYELQVVAKNGAVQTVQFLLK